MPAGGVGDQLPRLPGPRRAEPGDEVGQGVVGDRQHQQLRAGDDLVDREHRYAGQQLRGPAQRGVADAGDGNDLVARLLERCAEDGA